MKGIHYAAKIMALSAYELFRDQDGILNKAKAEFSENTKGVAYIPGIPDTVKPL